LNQKGQTSDGSESESDTTTEKFLARINDIENELKQDLNYGDILDEQASQDDEDMRELIKHAKLKLKLKYYNEKRRAQYNLANGIEASSESESNSTSSSSSVHNEMNASEFLLKKNLKLNEEKTKKHSQMTNDSNDLEISEYKRYLIENLNKEKDSLETANELLNQYRQAISKRKMRLNTAQSELKLDEQVLSKLKPSEKAKQQHALDDKRLVVERPSFFFFIFIEHCFGQTIKLTIIRILFEI
jgi:hypothetical protein